MVTAKLRRRDDQLMIVQICAARKDESRCSLGSRRVVGEALLLKVKNPKAPAVKREAEEDCCKKSWRRR
jgi:hypothetical protein